MSHVRLLEECRLYGIVDSAYLAGRDPADVAGRMIEGGVDILQVRAKDQAREQIVAWSRAVVAVARPRGVPVIVNDHPEIAAEVEADGVHVGQEDGSLVDVRKRAGKGCWVGRSTHSREQALAAQKEGADYIGVGPVFATPTKPSYTPVGLELVRQVTPVIRIPFFAIGGIKLQNIAQVLEAGASRVVVVSGILQAKDPTEYCRQLRRRIQESGARI